MTLRPVHIDAASIHGFQVLADKLDLAADAARSRHADSDEARLAARLSAALAQDAAEAIRRLIERANR
jgi:hypothetical protein